MPTKKVNEKFPTRESTTSGATNNDILVFLVVVVI